MNSGKWDVESESSGRLIPEVYPSSDFNTGFGPTYPHPPLHEKDPEVRANSMRSGEE